MSVILVFRRQDCKHCKDAKGIWVMKEVEQEGLHILNNEVGSHTHGFSVGQNEQGFWFTSVSPGPGIPACHILMPINTFES